MIALLLALLQEGRTREVAYSDRPIEILVPVSADAKHVGTVVTFPEESLESLVAGWNEEDLSLERRRDRLFVKLLRRAEGDLHVLGASGTLYRLYVRPAEREFDGHVRIARPAKDASRPGAIDLIRAMRTAQIPEGALVRRASGVVYRSERMTLTARYVYDTDFHRGYVLVLENHATEPMRIDPSRFAGEGLDLVGAKSLIVEAGGKTQIYLVFWK